MTTTTTTELEEFVGGDFSELIDHKAVAWIDERIREEQTRLKHANVQALPLTIKNMSISVDTTHPQKPRAINRIEVRTHFNFDTVKEIMISDPIPYPHKDRFVFVHLLLFTDKPLPLLLPYLYDPELTVQEGEEPAVPVRNRLNDWLFTNQKGDTSRHQIKTFHRQI